MKMSDIVSTLASRIPTIDTRFCDTFTAEVTSVDNTFFYVKVPVESNIRVGQNVVISGIGNKNPILKVTERDDLFFMRTKYDHGLNYDKYYETPIKIQGSSLETFRGTLEGVIGSNELIVASKEVFQVSQPALIMEEGFNEFYEVQEAHVDPDDVDFLLIKLDVNVDIFTQPHAPSQIGTIQTSVRVVGVPDIERFNALYTAQSKDELWLAVTTPENRSSRDRGVPSDSIIAYMDPTAQSGPMEIRQIHVETISVFCAIPASYTVSGRYAVDIAEEVRFVLYRALCGVDIPSQAHSSERYPLMPVRDGYFSYLSDNTTYVHEYVFERSIVLTTDDIGVSKQITAPYRGLELTLAPCKA